MRLFKLHLYTACAAAILAPTLSAAPKSRPVVKKTQAPKKATARGPVNLGSGVYLLGEGGASLPPKISAPFLPGQVVGQRKAETASQFQTGAQLVQFCRSYLGRKLGNGQCSELAVLGLPAVKARLDFNNLWGDFVCQFSVSGGNPTIHIATKDGRKPQVRPGDIIQYEGVKFEKRWDSGYSFREYPHHTSIVEHVSRDGLSIGVLEQNVNNTQYVLRSTLHIPEMTTGTMRITRPIPR